MPEGVRKRSAAQADQMAGVPRHSRRPTGLTPEIVAEALKRNGGIMSAAAAQLGVTRQTIYQWTLAQPQLRQVIAEARELTLDLAEGKLLQAIRNDNLTATIFFLKCHGKARGYVERQEHTGPGGGPINVVDLSSIPNEDLAVLEEILLRNRALPSPGETPPPSDAIEISERDVAATSEDGAPATS